MRSVGDSYAPVYLPIVEKRKDTPYGERERSFQLYRRGPNFEFNQVYDRGTTFGLQTGRQSWAAEYSNRRLRRRLAVVHPLGRHEEW